MNLRLVIAQLGLLLLLLSAALVCVAGYQLLAQRLDYQAQDEAIYAMLISTGIGLASGLACWIWGRSGDQKTFQRREALLLTASSWLICGVVAALPYWIWVLLGGANEEVGAPRDHEFHSFASCYFEAISGLTTTGSTVLGERGTIENLPPGLMLWRSLTHWLGGLGIVVLFVAVLPQLGVGAKHLYQSEYSAQDGGVRPRIKETARVLWLLYLGISASAALSFWLTGMTAFDAVNHAMSVMATGGLSTKNTSIGYYDSHSLDIAMTIFMLLAGVNFAIFYRFARGRWRLAFADIELRWYIGLKLVGIAIITFDIWHTWLLTTVADKWIWADFTQALRFASFQVTSLQTGTGFGTADYDTWPVLSKGMLLGLMFIGGCAGSTAGGVKVVRFVVMAKVCWAAFEKAFRPNVVRPVKLGGTTVDEDVQMAALVYVTWFMFLFVVGGFLLMLLEPHVLLGGRSNFETCMTASLASLANVGPGMGFVGATDHFGWFSAPSKLLLSLWMVLGRLEIYAIFVLVTFRFWRRD